MGGGRAPGALAARICFRDLRRRWLHGVRHMVALRGDVAGGLSGATPGAIGAGVAITVPLSVQPGAASAGRRHFAAIRAGISMPYAAAWSGVCVAR